MENNEKRQRIIIIAVVCASILVISLIAVLVNRNKSDEIAEESTQGESGYESASTQMGKTVEEAEEEYDSPKIIEKDNTTSSKNNTISTENNIAREENKTVEIIAKEVDEKEEDNAVEENDEEDEVKEESSNPITFEAPIKGEILREFASDSLVYSETLKEWIIHKGVDIKADKTSVVSACAPGTVQAIKNDPRYGLTVIINHDDGYQTIYSNLLTAEFVVQGEKVEQGQSIGTVGNSAAFEVSDDYHLHFELLQNNENLDPTIYMEF